MYDRGQRELRFVKQGLGAVMRDVYRGLGRKVGLDSMLVQHS